MRGLTGSEERVWSTARLNRPGLQIGDGFSVVSDRPIIIDLNAPVRLADVPDLARRFFQWWVGEIAELAPGWAHGLFPKPVELSTLHVGEGLWHIVPAAPGAHALDIDSSQDDKGIADQILRAAPNFGLVELAVVLPPSTVLRRRIELPLMPEHQVLSAVELQIDRLTPFKSDAVRFAVRIAARDVIEGKLSVDAAITPRAAVDALEQRLTRLGFRASVIDFEDGAGERAGFNLCAAQPPASQRSTVIKAGLVAAAICSWYFAGVLWDTAREQEVEAWRSRIVELRPVALRGAALRQQVEGMTQPIAIAQRHKPGVVLGSLKELTALLPDTARLTEFKYSSDGIELAGLANEATQLISKIDSSKLFKNVTFRSPVLRRPESNKDRFEISLKVETGAKP